MPGTHRLRILDHLRLDHLRFAIPGIVLSGILALCFILPLSACDRASQPVSVDTSKRAQVTATKEVTDNNQAIRLGIGSMITPKQGYIYYRRLSNYLEKRLKRPVTIVDRGTYREFNNLLAGGGLDMAFVCGGPYVQGYRDFGLKLLVVPETLSGERIYRSLLIVPKESPARTLDDLRGSTFAFTDPQSNTGRLVPTYMLAQRGERPESFFGKLVYTYAHDQSIRAVASGVVDGAAVDSLIYRYMVASDPQMVDKTRILVSSGPYGIPPVVVRPGLPQELFDKLQTTLLTMHEDPEGKSILSGMMLNRFVTSDDSAYDNIRKIERVIGTFEERQ
jgi:phosphonate transport system substrate-binding protein